MKKEQDCIDTLTKRMYVLQLCLEACTKGKAWQRNPYIRSTTTKKNLIALQQSIEQVVVAIFAFSACYAKEHRETRALHTYYEAYAFLFDFNDGIKREEYYHRILIREQGTLLLFTKLQAQTEKIIKTM